MIFNAKTDKSFRTSVPKSKTLYGVEIKKVPIGRYLDVLEGNEGLPAELLEKLFPGKDIQNVLDFFIRLDKDGLSEFLSRALTVLPRELLRLLSELYDIDEGRLLDSRCADPITPFELTEIIKSFWELNDMSAFFKTVLAVIPGLTARKTGSSGLSQSESVSE